jgi:hypothetical protein
MVIGLITPPGTGGVIETHSSRCLVEIDVANVAFVVSGVDLEGSRLEPFPADEPRCANRGNHDVSAGDSGRPSVWEWQIRRESMATLLASATLHVHVGNGGRVLAYEHCG